MNHPYEWCTRGNNGDQYLRKLPKGKHKITCKVYDKCGKWKEFHCWIVVGHGGGGYPGGGGGGQYCDYTCKFQYPYNEQRYQYGKAVSVKLDIKNYQKVKYVECYVDGKFIRKETSYPYEWCRSGSRGDDYLRKLPKGKHKITCKVYDICGKWKEYHCWIWIDGHGGGGYPDDDGPAYCDYTCKFQYPYDQQHYEYGKPVSVKLDIKNYQKVKYVECYVGNKLISRKTKYPYEWCRPNYRGDDYLRKLPVGKHKIICKVYDHCGKWKEYVCWVWIDGHGGGGHPGGGGYCNYKAYFKYPRENQQYNYGNPVHVKLEIDKYHEVKYVECYVDGQFVSREDRPSYEWAKPGTGSDRALRNLGKGKHKITCKVYDKCGKWKEYHCWVVIGHGGGGGYPDVGGGHPGGGGHCEYNAWYYKTKDIKRYRYGQPVYVKLNVDNYRKIKHVECYVDGKFVRKELRYPYEWCTRGNNNDGYLRRLSKGKHKITCKVYDTCGGWKEYHHEVLIY